MYVGCAEERLFVDGNLKYDIELSQTDKLKADSWKESSEGRSIWLGSSTHPGEHEQLLAAHKRILEHEPDACLIIAPRHPEQFEALQN